MDLSFKVIFGGQDFGDILEDWIFEEEFHKIWFVGFKYI